jgi:hypothetical protein
VLDTPVSGLSAKRGFPRRVSSIPSATTGCGSAGKHRRGVVEEGRVHHRPGQTTVPPCLRHRAAPRSTARPAAPRSRLITRIRKGICGTDSVNEARRHPVSSHRHRRFRHTNRAATGKATSRGSVVTHPSPRSTAPPTLDTPAASPTWTRAPPGYRPDRVRPPPRAAPTTTSQEFIPTRSSS